MNVNSDAWICAFHLLYRSAFLLKALPAAAGVPASPATGESAQAKTSIEAPYSRTLVFVHMLGFFPLYLAVGETIFGRWEVRELFPYQRVVAGAIFVLDTAFVAWTLLSFRSWRIRAAIEPGHVLATSGPFAWVRNPIYLSLALLAVATTIWIPSFASALGLAMIVIGGDLRARAEERVLDASFGEPYRAYRARVKRFVPGIY
jgi:protein-S-isoprenylcysteine O-methyltransferase Ste14